MLRTRVFFSARRATKRQAFFWHYWQMIRTAIMKAVRVHKFGGPEVLQVETVEIPVPTENDVLIKVKAVGVNPSETYMRAGTYGPVDFPFTPGKDAAGIVEAVGANVTDVKIGSRVFCLGFSGSYAEYILAKSSRVWRLPDYLSFSQGAALPVPYFTALRALKYKAKVNSGESVLIHGASGAVGIAACQLGSAMKLDIVGTASSAEGKALVMKNGARIVLDHTDPKHAQNLKEASSGKGFNVILEMLANVNLMTDLDVAADSGRIVIIGSRGKIEVDPRHLMRNEVTCVGVMLMKATEMEWAEMGNDMQRAFESRCIDPVIDKELTLEHAAQAHVEVIDHTSGAQGKIVLTVG